MSLYRSIQNIDNEHNDRENLKAVKMRYWWRMEFYIFILLYVTKNRIYVKQKMSFFAENIYKINKE